jgi:hypothetical protein
MLAAELVSVEKKQWPKWAASAGRGPPGLPPEGQ